MFRRLTLVLVLLWCFAPPLAAQQSGTIAGTVVSAEGDPIAGAQITLVQLNRSARSAEDGAFVIPNVAPGRYLLQVFSPRWGSAVRQITALPGETVTMTVELELAVHREEIVVSASPEARAADETYQPVEVLGHEELALRLEPSLGETLAKSPGVTSTYFGPASSRPVIRGFGGDRIRILEEGIGVGDASNVSPDHAVSYDPINAEHIEIVRGPATLLYGSNAVGGLVNIRDERIPTVAAGVPATGTVDLGVSTAARGTSASVSLDGSFASVGWTLGAFRRENDDVEIPGPPERDASEEEREEFDGTLVNSALETDGLSAGISWIAERGFAGVSISTFDSLYGIPVHAHHEEEANGTIGAFQEEHEEDIRVDLEQRRFDFRSELRDPFPFFRSIKLRFGMSDYQHTELEGDEIGTLFESESWEGRLEAPHRPLGRFIGTLGAQFSNRDFAAIGAEAFVPASTTSSSALFLFEETRVGSVDLQFGGRWESNDVDVDVADLPDRTFAGVSGSFGLVWRPAPQWVLSSSISRAVRAPTAEELFSNGPHLATFTFEVGNPMLDEEVSLGADLSLSKTAGTVTGELNLFLSRFDGYIYQASTGEEEDDLPVFLFRQDDARFSGLEAEAHVPLWRNDPSHLDLEISGDYVQAELSGGENLPRIPPLRMGVGVHYHADRVWGRAEVRRVFEQDEVAPLEEPTDGYTMVNAGVGYRFFVGETVHELTLRGTNLTDQLARTHVSPLKEFVPLPGRDFSLKYRLTF